MDQKRAYRRIDDPVDVDFISSAPGVTTIIKTSTLDIGAGGIKVYLNHKYAAGVRMCLKMKLPEMNKTVEAEVEVLLATRANVLLDSGREVLYETRFKFVEIDMQTKRDIIAYVYEFRKKQNLKRD